MYQILARANKGEQIQDKYSLISGFHMVSDTG